jgi:hypothetical protein
MTNVSNAAAPSTFRMLLEERNQENKPRNHKEIRERTNQNRAASNPTQALTRKRRRERQHRFPIRSDKRMALKLRGA